jgi:5-methylcytosine-specific restriction endonuclease McrA
MTDDAKKKSKETYLKNLKNGLIKHPSGKNHPRWKGGEKETTKQGILSGKRQASVKKYRSKNPDKVREWSKTRHNRKTGRLPRGTVKSIGNSQKWLCVYCKLDVSIKYHADHIIPLAKGGKHEPSNIQILCPSCNVKKSTKLNYVHTDN